MGDEIQSAAFAGTIDLAAEKIGGEALACSDDFFASVDNLLKSGRGEFDPNAYYERGKVMDGWESRRRRSPGHDWAIIKLGVAGQIEAFDLDTNHFLGNHAPWASVDACVATDDASVEELRTQTEWTELLTQVPLVRGARNLFAVNANADENASFTHVRLRIFPDGGVARFRVFGTPAPLASETVTDLAAVSSGGRAVGCSDMFFSSPDNLLLPGRAENMSSGWESRRRRDDGHDWAVIALGATGTIERILVDTNHFRGNFPDRVSFEGIHWPNAHPTTLLRSLDWVPILAQHKLAEHEERSFTKLLHSGPFSHIRMRIFPCGGISRLRVFGRKTQSVAENDALVNSLNQCSEQEAIEHFEQCCGAKRFARGLAQKRPFPSRAALFGEAERHWWSLDDADWLQAFTQHPQIGADKSVLRKKFASTAQWAGGEQAGVQQANEATLNALAEANQEYLERFGFIFIICASGLSAQEMLDALHFRLVNKKADEVRYAAQEQAKITRLRLAKLATALHDEKTGEDT